MKALTHRMVHGLRRASPPLWESVALVAVGAMLGAIGASLASRYAASRRAALHPRPDPTAVDVWKNEGGSTTQARAVSKGIGA